MEENRILKLMIAHHGLLEALLVLFRDSLDNSDEAKKIFDDFKWQMEKHFFIEEKINFGRIVAAQPGLSEVVRKLLEEHGQMLVMAGRIKEQLEKDGKDVDMDGFLDLIKRHRQTEEGTLYPRMGEVLSQEEQGGIIERINEVAFKKAVEQ